MSLEKRLKHVEDDVHGLTKDLLELIQYLQKGHRSETKEAFTNRLRDAQKHYMDSTNPKHPNFDPDMSEYYRGKSHGLMIAADLIEDYLKEF